MFMLLGVFKQLQDPLLLVRTQNGAGTSRARRTGVWSLNGALAGASDLGIGFAVGMHVGPVCGFSAPQENQNKREQQAFRFHWALSMGESRGTGHPPASGKAARPQLLCFCPWLCHTETVARPWLISGLSLFSPFTSSPRGVEPHAEPGTKGGTSHSHPT